MDLMNATLKCVAGIGLQFVPRQDSFSQMAYEMGVLYDIQVAEDYNIFCNVRDLAY